MKVVINSQVTLSRVPEGPVAPYLGMFADFSQWLGQKGVALQRPYLYSGAP